MNDNLSRDAFIVFATWFLVAFIISGCPIQLAPAVMGGVLIIWLMGVAGGLASAWFTIEGGMIFTKRKLRSSFTGPARHAVEAKIMDSDACRTLYNVPLPVVAEPEKGRVRRNKLHSLPWWSAYKKAHPDYAYVLDEVYAVMESKPGIPAGYQDKYASSHPDRSLIDHSLDVVAAVLRLAPSWTFDGVKNKAGKVIVPLQKPEDGPLRIVGGSAISQPLLPLIAFAHDIGKVACYQLDKKGRVTSVLDSHGMRGAALLRKLNAVQNLPMPDRDALLLAVEFYHRLSLMPSSKWIPDRVRSLTALLHVADCQCGDITESSTGVEGDTAQAYLSHVDANIPETPDEKSEHQRAEDTSHEPEPPAKPIDQPSPSAASEDLAFVFDNGASALDVFTEVINSPGAVNGKNKKTRIAWKNEALIYVQTGPLLRNSADYADTPALISDKVTKGKFLRSLLTQIHESGHLIITNDDLELAAPDAIWNVRSAKSAEAEESAAVYEAFVVSIDMASHLSNIPDAPYAPVIIGPASSRPASANAAPAAKEAEAPTPSPSAALDLLDELESQEADGLTSTLANQSAPQPHDEESGPAVHAHTVAAQSTGQREAGNSAAQHPKPGGVIAGEIGRNQGKRMRNAETERGCDMLTRNKSVINRDALVNLATCGDTPYGLRIMEVSGRRLAVFDLTLISAVYEIDVEHLPEGVVFLEEKNSLVVAL